MLLYSGTRVEFDDRLLTHLEIVVVNKLRRGESFLLSWRDGVAIGSGRAAIWLTPGVPVSFRFTTSRVPEIDREWIALLAAGDAESLGLVVVEEDGTPAQSGAVGAGGAGGQGY
jgi:hypothetical protein